MAKSGKIYYCQNCGTRHTQWMGQCPVCKQWNTIVEEVVSRRDVKKGAAAPAPKRVRTLRLTDIDGQSGRRLTTSDGELDTVLGGGLVPGSVTLLGGEPGIGKSTLLLQAALRMPYKVLYVSGEESPAQIKMRARRLGMDENNRVLILPETHMQTILPEAQREQPQVIVVDSIQTLHTDYVDSSPGSVSQIRETAAEWIRYAKETGTPVLLIGHITKEGVIAGPKVLEHMVDTVLQFEGDRYHRFRILRALKNRYGNTREIGLYEMTAKGLEPVQNPSGIIPGTHGEASGTALGMVSEGVRSFAVETQALVSPSVYGTPQRSVTGYDLKRLHMILAVLEKRAGMRLLQNDVFLNITGGLRITDTALDLAVAAALVSSYEDEPLPPDTAFMGEIGLTGEIRPVSGDARQALHEAAKIGIRKIYVSAHQSLESVPDGLEVVRWMKVSQLYHLF